MIQLKKWLAAGLAGILVFAVGCRSAYVPVVLTNHKDMVQGSGMNLTKIDGLSGDADTYLFEETEDDAFTGQAAICYNVTKDRVVYSVRSDYSFQTDRFSSLSILKSVLEYETGEDYVSMMEERYMQDLRLNDLFRTVKELVNYKEFLSLFQKTSYRSSYARLRSVAQYDCWDETNGCMRFLYIEKDGAQDYILLLIGVDSDQELDLQTDHILSNLIR